MHILIIGKSFSGLKKYLLENGYEYTVLQDVLETKYPNKKFKNRVVVDFSNEASVLKAISSINNKKNIDGVTKIYEKYVVWSAIISEFLGVPGIPISAAQACTDKELMRTLFAKCPEKISPDFLIASSEKDIINFSNKHNFPLILKPANLSKSLLVTKSDNIDELLNNFSKSMETIDEVYNKYASGRKPKMIIEEFLNGPVFSVDAFVDSTGEPHVLENVVDYQTGYDIGYDDNFHYSRILPSSLAQDKIDKIRRLAVLGCKSLGMQSSPAHIEIIYTSDGPRIVEIGARNGGYRERMHWLANDIDITANAIALSLNQPLDISPKKNECIGVFELFPKNPGIFECINNEKNLRSLESFNYLSVKAKSGQFVGKSGDGYKMCAVVILKNKYQDKFKKDMEFLNNKVSVKTI